jgi:hypothetical protein
MPYSPEQIQQAMRAAHAAGDQEAVADLRQRLTEAYQSEVPGAAEGMSRGEQFRAGIGQGMTNIARQAGNMVGLKSNESLQDAAALDRSLLGTGAGRAGSVVGEIAATAPLGGLAAGGARAAGAGLIRAGMAEGAAQGALTAGPGSRLGGAAQGAALGAVLPGVARGVQRVAAPLRATRDAMKLARRGVRVTPGEMNPTGALNQYEQTLQSSAVGGAALRRAREQSMRDWQRAVGNEAMPAGTAPLKHADPSGMVRDAERAYGQGYEGAIGGYNALEPRIVRTAGGDVPLHTYQGPGGPSGAMVEATSASYPGRLVKPEARSQMLGALESELSPVNRLRTTGRELQGVRSNIRSMARDSDVAGERALLRGGEQKITEALKSQLAPEDFAKLAALDAKYGDFKILQDAVARSRSAPGGFTPFQLESSVGKMTDLGEYARGGGGGMRELSKAGRKTFEQRVQPTGERQVLTGFLGRLGTPIAATGMVGLTKIPTKVLMGQTAKQKALRAALRAARRNHTGDLQAAQSLGTAALIQNEQE